MVTYPSSLCVHYFDEAFHEALDAHEELLLGVRDTPFNEGM
jgi:hypothetical protein